MKPSAVLPFGSLLAFLLGAALPAHKVGAEQRPAFRSSTPAGTHKLIASIRPAGNGTVEGSVLFEKIPDGVRVTARIGGLDPNSVHALRIHVGSNHDAGLGGSREMLQPGDLGNLMSDKRGNATQVLDLDWRSLGSGDLVGLAITVHENAGTGESPDKEAGDPIGAGMIRTMR